MRSYSARGAHSLSLCYTEVLMSDAFRTRETSEKYRALRSSGTMDSGCALCEASPIKAFNHWKIIGNNFPYDLIAETHHMIVPLRHVKETEITEEEWAEYQQIKEKDLQEYGYIIEATNRTKSIPAHFHLHLITSKENICS